MGQPVLKVYRPATLLKITLKITYRISTDWEYVKLIRDFLLRGGDRYNQHGGGEYHFRSARERKR